jgi:hypothetical protein
VGEGGRQRKRYLQYVYKYKCIFCVQLRSQEQEEIRQTGERTKKFRRKNRGVKRAKEMEEK